MVIVGSRGFFAVGKTQTLAPHCVRCSAGVEGKKYQVQVQLVEIGSKPAAAATDQATETKE